MSTSLPEAPEGLGGGAGGLTVAAEHEVTARKNIYTVFYLISSLPVECVTLEAGVREAAEASG